jgi:hypothetical protein
MEKKKECVVVCVRERALVRGSERERERGFLERLGDGDLS